MANSDKNIRITTSRNKATFPNIVFTGSAAGSSVITLNILDDNSMSFESNEGQVFSLDSNLSTGTIWGVSDISGIPLLRASAGATIGLAEYSGFVGIGTNIPTYKLHVRGLAAFASTADQTLSFIFDTSLAAGSANLQVRRGNTIRFYASGDTLYTAIKAATTNTYTLTLPPAVPSAGSTFLTSDTSGNLAWAAPPTPGTATTAANVNSVSATSDATHFLLFSPTNGGSGVAVSSGTGLTFNPSTGLATIGGTASITQRLTVGSSLNSTSTSTGALVNSGGLGMAGNAFIGGTFNITNTTASGSTISGALVVTGGGAIGQSLSVGGFLQLFNGANYSSFRYTGSATTIYTLPANSPQSATGTSVLSSTIDGTMSWVGMSGGSASPGGVDTSIQFNDGGSAFGGTSYFTFNKTTQLVGIAATLNAVANYAVGLRLFNDQSTSQSAVQRRSSPAIEMVGIANTGVVTGGRFNRFGIYSLGVSQSYEADLRFLYSYDTGTAGFTTIFSINSLNGIGIGASDASFINYFRTSSTQAANKSYVLPTDYPGTGTSVLQSNTTGTLTWVPMTSGGSGVVNSGTAGSVAFYAADGTTISGSSDIYISSGNGITINATTGSGSTTTGALVVKGGVGIGGTVNLWAAINAWGNSEFRAYNASNFYVAHDASTSLGVNSSYKWPTYPSGTASSFLSSDTSGNLVWLAPSGGTATKRFHLLTLAAGYTPATGTTADDAVYRIPYSPEDGSTQLTWNVREAFLRTETTTAGISTVQIEYNTGTGVFDPPTGVVLTGIGLSVGGAGVAETFHRTFNQSTLTSGTKVRLRFGTINSSHADFLITLLLEEQ